MMIGVVMSYANESIVRVGSLSDAGYNPRDQWDENLSAGRFGTSAKAA
jgi:hypothetical protein